MITSSEISPIWPEYGFSFSLSGYEEMSAGEWLFLYHPNCTFYFMHSDDFDMEQYCAQNNWYIITSSRFNENTMLGVGFLDGDMVNGLFYNVENEAKLKMWKDILNFTFNQEYKELYFPYDNYFNGMLRLDGSICFYIHDYIPVSHKTEMTLEQRKTANMVFRFKEGFYLPFMTTVFKLAMERLRIITKNRSNTILIPIPASTAERNDKRFSKLIRTISRKLNIEDGFNSITILHDREQLKGCGSTKDKLSNLSFADERIQGKNIILIDDILTTGSGFIQHKRKLMELGAHAVTGIFLARTKEPRME